MELHILLIQLLFVIAGLVPAIQGQRRVQSCMMPIPAQMTAVAHGSPLFRSPFTPQQEVRHALPQPQQRSALDARDPRDQPEDRQGRA